MTELPSDIARVLISADDIRTRVKELAVQISRDYSNIDQIYMIGILKGAFIFLADLAREIQTPHSIDFMALSSYGKTTTSGEVRILMDLREPVGGRHVMIVEDIVDTGHTLNYLYKLLLDRNPASLHTCALVRKIRPGINVTVDYLGFDIPDVWVVGYGLDFADKHRTLPYIAEIKRDT